jgi:hypothetical protein
MFQMLGVFAEFDRAMVAASSYLRHWVVLAEVKPAPQPGRSCESQCRTHLRVEGAVFGKHVV